VPNGALETTNDCARTNYKAVILNKQPSSDTVGVVKKLGLKGVGGFGLSSGESPILAAFVPEGKGIPGFIGLWKLQDLDKSPNSPPPYARRSFFRVSTARGISRTSRIKGE
jgi:hypothetical protein